MPWGCWVVTLCHQGIIPSFNYNHVKESPEEILPLFLPCILRLLACSSPVSLSTWACKLAILRSDSVFCSFYLLPKAILASRSVWTVWTNSFIWSRYCLRSISGISPIQRHHYITNSYTYQFLKKVIFCSPLQYRSALVVARMRNIILYLSYSSKKRLIMEVTACGDRLTWTIPIITTCSPSIK